MNRLISGGVTVAFATPPERGQGESQLILQAAGADSDGNRYVYDRGFIIRVTHPLEFHRVSSAVLAALLSLEADTTRGSLYVFTWEDHVGASHAVRFVGEIRYKETGPDRYEVEFTLEEDVPLSPPPAPASFDAALAARNDVAPVWMLKLTAGGIDYYPSAAAFSIAGWNGGVTTLPWVEQWGELTEQVTGALNEIRRSDFTVRLLVDESDPDNIKALAETYNLEKEPCSLYLWYLGLDAAVDPPREVFRGYVRGISIPDEFSVSLTLEDETCRLEGLVGRIATPELFPAMLTNHAGRMIPIVMGQAKNVVPPCVMVDATSWYYMIDCPLSSFDAIFRRNSDGTVTDITATATKYLGTPDSSHPDFPGKAMIVQPKQSAVVTPGTATATTTVRALYEAGGPTHGGSWSGVPSGIQAVDGDDNSFANCIGVANPTYIQLQFPLSVSPVTRVKARMKIYSTQPYTITVYNQSMAVLGTYDGTACSDGTVVDTGWFAASGITYAYAKITFTNLAGQNYRLYAGWLDVEYAAATSTTSYVANSADILVACSRLVGNYARTGIVYRPNAFGSVTTANVTNQANMYDADPATYGTLVQSVNGNQGWIQWTRSFLAGVSGAYRRIRGCILITATKTPGQSNSIAVQATVGSVTTTFNCNLSADTTVTGVTLKTPWIVVPAGASSAILTAYAIGYIISCNVYDVWWELEAGDGLCDLPQAADLLLGVSSELDVSRTNLSSPSTSASGFTLSNIANAYDGDPATYATLTYSPSGTASLYLIQKVPSLASAKGWVRACFITDVAPTSVILQIDGNNASFTAVSGFVAGQPVYSKWYGISDTTTDRQSWNVGIFGTATIKLYDVWLEYMPEVPAPASQTVFSGPVLPVYYTVNGAITEQKRTIDWLTRLAFEFRCFFRYSLGVPTLIYRPDTAAADVTVSACRIESGKKVYSRRRAPISEVINTINLCYGRDYSVSDGPEAYSGIVSEVDAASIADFGPQEQPELFRLNFVTDPNLAADLLAFYLAYHAPRYWEDQFETFLDRFGVSFADVVEMAFLSAAPTGLVVEVGLRPGNGTEMDCIRFTLRT